MMEVVALCGPARSGKTTHLQQRYAEFLLAHRIPRSSSSYLQRDCLWICPHLLRGQSVSRQLLSGGQASALSAVAAVQVCTPGQLASLILADSASPQSRMDEIVKRDTITALLRAMEQEGELKALAPYAQSSRLREFVVNVIGRLQRHAIGVDALRSSPFVKTPRRRELASLYERYLGILAAGRFYDDAGQVAQALAALNSGEVPIAKLELLVIDGFAEMRWADFELLRQHVAQAKRTYISFVTDATNANERRSLFARSIELRERWQNAFPELKVEYCTGVDATWPARAFLSQHLFRDPRDMPETPRLPKDTFRIDVMESASNRDEWRSIVGRIKESLHRAEPTSDIACDAEIVVAVRGLAEAAPRIHRACEEYGVPYAIDVAPNLLSAPSIRALLDLLELQLQDWPFRKLLDVVGNRLFCQFEDLQRANAEWLIREFQLPAKRADFMELVHHWGKATETMSWQRKRLYQAVCNSVDLFEELNQGCAGLPSSGPVTKWIDAIEAVAERLGLRLEPEDGSEWAEAWRRLRGCMLSLATPVRAAGETHRASLEGKSLTLSELMARMTEIGLSEHLPQRGYDEGSVRFVTPETARHMTMRHLIVADLSEQSFPSIDRGGALLTPDEIEQIARTERDAARCDEAVQPYQSDMLLFYQLVNCPSERLTFSYTALDDKALPLLPSPFLGEVQSLFQKDSQIPVSPPRLHPVPDVDQPRSLAEWRLSAIGQVLAKRKQTPLLRAIWSVESFSCRESLESGVRSVASRGKGGEFGDYEGVFQAGPVVGEVADHFGEQHLWSASQLEQYAECPFKFFAANVLRCHPLSRLALETDHASRGTTLHETLARYHSNQTASGLDQDEELLDGVLEVLDAVTREARGFGKLPAIHEIEKRQLAEWLQDYEQQLLDYRKLSSSFEEPLQPTHYEIRFGPPMQADDEDDPFEDEASDSEPLRLSLDGMEIKVTGRIDRIDTGKLAGHLFFSVVDFKTGNPTYLKPLSADLVRTGKSLQIPIYIKAAQSLLRQDGAEAYPWQGGYWAIREKGFVTQRAKNANTSLSAVKGQTVVATSEWEDIEKALQTRVPMLVQGIRQGHFPMINADDQCTTRCDFRTVCRVSLARSLEKERPETP